MTSPRSALPTSLVLSLAGCYGKVNLGGSDGGVPDGGGGEPCGPTTCGAGTVCCSSSCGICTAPGEACPAIACTTECRSNAECGPSDYYDHCAPTSSCVTDAECDPTRFCHYAIGGCGGTGDELGECRARGAATACTFDGTPVCGCDGVTYGCEAMADAAGASILHEGACEVTGPCDPQDARGDGPSAAFFGYAWDGSRCIGLSGCGCVGSDCGATFGSLAECDLAHRGCESPPGGTCGGFGGFVCRPDEWCDFTDPHYCGGADETGVCQPRPTACADILDTACGCDGATYPNPCEAHAAGFDTRSDPSTCPLGGP